MSTCLLKIGDGRDEVHERSDASLRAAFPGFRFDHVVIVNDADHELGFAGAVQKGWDDVLATGADWVWHAEMDFLYRAVLPLPRMIELLERHSELAQIVLKRQPCNHEERAAGGIVEQHPEDFAECYDGRDYWTTHRRFWSTNPSLYSTRYCRMGWPQEAESEGKFTHRLLADPLLRFAFWGRKYDAPLVEHIGERVGIGY
jgi:hypothetical protein